MNGSFVYPENLEDVRTAYLSLAQLRANGVRVCCARCKWEPPNEATWQCGLNGCEAVWNTFDTQGRCPGCRVQWLRTLCLKCRKATPHGDWYSSPGAGGRPQS